MTAADRAVICRYIDAIEDNMREWERRRIARAQQAEEDRVRAAQYLAALREAVRVLSMEPDEYDRETGLPFCGDDWS